MSTPSRAIRITIVGAGITGLSVYLFLKKHLPTTLQYEILIYETYAVPTRQERGSSKQEPVTRETASFIGGGLGVAPNGMRILRQLDRKIHEAVVAQGYPTLRFQMKNSRNWTLGSVPTVDVQDGRPEVMIMSTRQGVWDCLRDEVPDEALRTGEAVTGIKRGPDGTPSLVLAGGGSYECDLIIGADGVKSVVKKAVVDEENFQPIYEGLCGIGGLIRPTCLRPLPQKLILPAPQSSVVMTFGAEGFFGYSPCNTDSDSTSQPFTSSEIRDNKTLPYGPLAMWWSTFSVDQPPHSTKVIDKEVIRAQLLARHSKWKDPVVQKIIADPSISVMTATFVTPKLPTWVSDRVVLAGDAAHTLPSSSGQGASQGLEDAQALALLLARYLQDPSIIQEGREATADPKVVQIQAAIKAFEAIRKPRVEAILDFSRRMGNRKKKMGFVAEWMTYLFMWVLCTFFSGYMNSMLRQWDVHAEIEKVVGDSQERKNSREVE